MLCWGLWPGTIKLAGKWRVELYYIDFAIGIVFASLIAAFTFGSMGWDGFSVFDDFHLAGKKHDLFAFLAGTVFSLGNMLLIPAISLAGIAYAHADRHGHRCLRRRMRSVSGNREEACCCCLRDDRRRGRCFCGDRLQGSPESPAGNRSGARQKGAPKNLSYKGNCHRSS